MCGLVGVIGLKGALDDETLRVLPTMAAALRHRGPDQASSWCEEEIALAHRRLSILDTSEAGLQPMVSHSGRYVMVYNGEIYNYRPLAAQLEREHGVQFLSSSDTEVLLEYISHYGFRRTLSQLNGMFAIAVWDRYEKTLMLARDRMGIKPLYWARRGDQVLFGSEVRAFYHHPSWTMDMSHAGLWDYFNNTYISEDRTAFKNCWKLSPGHFIELQRGKEPKLTEYWSLIDLAKQRSGATRKLTNFSDAVDQLDALMNEVISDQRKADVPLGAFLSGGIDSATVVSFLRKHGNVKTFSIGYKEANFDESKEAEVIASHLGAEHTSFILGSEDAADVIPKLPEIYDEPFADMSQIPTHIVSRLAGREVTVALSGDGGDELFAGYQRYVQNVETWEKGEKIPKWAKPIVAKMLSSVKPQYWRYLLKPLLADASKSVPFFADLLSKPTISSYQREANYLGIGNACLLEERDAAYGNEIFYEALGLVSPMDELLYVDQRRRLPDCMLTKVDRASMACGLEVRVPFLDNRIVDFSWSVPLNYLVRSGSQKAILREVLQKYLPRETFSMPKKGFHIPMKLWLSRDLRGWAESLMDDGLQDASEFIDAATARQMWGRYLDGNVGLTNSIWTILMFLSWQQSLKSRNL